MPPVQEVVYLRSVMGEEKSSRINYTRSRSQHLPPGRFTRNRSPCEDLGSRVEKEYGKLRLIRQIRLSGKNCHSTVCLFQAIVPLMIGDQLELA